MILKKRNERKIKLKKKQYIALSAELASEEAM
jgi:hypothetical protein